MHAKQLSCTVTALLTTLYASVPTMPPSFSKLRYTVLSAYLLRDDFVTKGVHENWTVGVESRVAGRLNLDVFLECAQC